MKKLTLSIACPLIALLAVNNAHAASLITNGDFESSITNLTTPLGWAATGGASTEVMAFKLHSVVPAASGDWAIDLGGSGTDVDNGGSLSQTFSILDPGTYVFEFDYSNESHHTSFFADFSWSLSGVANDGATLLGIGGGYTTFTQEYLITSTGNTTVTFSDIIGNGHAYDAIIDNVSFHVKPVPAPPVALLLGSGLIGLIRMRNKQVSA